MNRAFENLPRPLYNLQKYNSTEKLFVPSTRPIIPHSSAGQITTVIPLSDTMLIKLKLNNYGKDYPNIFVS